MATQSFVGNTSFNNLTFLATRTINFMSCANFVVAGTFTALGSANSLIVFSGTTANQYTIFRVSGQQSVQNVTATDIDSSVGNQVIDSSGTLTRTINWATSVASSWTKFRKTLSLYGTKSGVRQTIGV